MKGECTTDVRVVRGNLMITPHQAALHAFLAQWLQEELGLPSGFVSSLFHEGRVKLGSRQANPDSPIPSGTKIWLLGVSRAQSHSSKRDSGSQRLPTDLEDVAPTVLYEDEHMLIVDKPAGLLVHSDGTGIRDTLMNRVEEYLKAHTEDVHLFHVHRLDKDTTGCLLFAKHEFAARVLDAMMVRRQIHRTYVTIVSGRLPSSEGRFDAPIGRDRHRAGTYRVSVTGKAAVTNYRQLHSAKDASGRRDQAEASNVISLVTCWLETGRTHQIRVHLSAAGCPIVGDELYGGIRTGDGWEWTGEGFALHAFRLSLTHPYSKELIEVEAPLPQPFRSVINELGWQDVVL